MTTDERSLVETAEIIWNGDMDAHALAPSERRGHVRWGKVA